LAVLLICHGQPAYAQPQFQIVHSFAPIGTTAPLVVATDGFLYGTTAGGGSGHSGSIFRITTNGILNMMYSFTGGNDGCTPYAGLAQASDGNFYGTTYYGGTSNAGTFFRITTDGTLTTLYQFSGKDGRNPRGSLVQANDGNLYGTTYNGGSSNAGTVFQITFGGTLTTLHSFTGSGEGRNPYAGLAQADDGNLYGTTVYGGAAGYGTVFQITPSGTFSNLYSFGNGFDGANPYGRLLQANDNYLYGTSEAGGYSGTGTIFKISTNGEFGTLLSFPGAGSPAHPYAGLMQASDGNFYGTAALGGAGSAGGVFQVTPNGALTQFSLNGNGQWPLAELVQAKDGNLYGTTQIGGTNGNGTVFQLTLDGTLMTIASLSGIDGMQPEGGLMQASDGNLYGTTYQGGARDWGTIFQFTLDDSFTTIHSFNGTDGELPQVAKLAQVSDGSLYGTTPRGGTRANGTIFRTTVDGATTTLYSFTNYPTQMPLGLGYETALVQGSNGVLYGTTYNQGSNGLGTVFQIGTNGGFTTIYQFILSGSPFNPVAANGANPCTGLLQATDGNLYGTTFSGGSSNYGTVFRITSNGALTTLHSFIRTDGANPYSALIQATDGNLYGDTYAGGSNNIGTIFRITTDGTFTTLHSLNRADGGGPYASLIQAGDSCLYGITSYGGISNLGTIFRISTNGVLATLHSFVGGDGSRLGYPLVEAADGNLYGATPSGGLFGNGCIYRLLLPVIIQESHIADGNLNFSFQTVVDQSYTILQSANLAEPEWTVYTNFIGDGSLVQLSVPTVGMSQQFFRVSKP
jgi:uncharacterized repeat protein (TIGR03803 family)